MFPYDHFGNYTHCFFIVKEVTVTVKLSAFLTFTFL